MMSATQEKTAAGRAATHRKPETPSKHETPSKPETPSGTTQSRAQLHLTLVPDSVDRRHSPKPIEHIGLHLTRRGRTVLVLVLLLTAFSLRQAHSDAATTRDPVQIATQTTVHQGDTLWSVAQRVAPDRDPREIVFQLRRLNGLSGATLLVGQQLLVPSGR